MTELAQAESLILLHEPELLQALHTDGYDGFLALEPHLQSAGQFQGFSGPELSHTASQILQRLLQTMDWRYA